MREPPICNSKRSTNLSRIKPNLGEAFLRIRFVVSGLLLCLLSVGVDAAESRADLKTKIGPYLCKHHSPPSTPIEIWNLGIFDAQISGSLGGEESKHESSRRAMQNGFVSGRCHDKLFWTVSSAAPVPLTQLQKDVFIASKKHLLKYCRSYRLDFVSDRLSVPTPIAKSFLGDDSNGNLKVNLSTFERGTASLTCLPRSKNTGPKLWYLFPIKGGPDFLVPHEGLFVGSNRLVQQLTGWLAKIRLDLRLSALEFNNPKINALSQELRLRHSPNHDRFELRKLKESFLAEGYRFLGENRVIGKSLKEVAWLLYHSPRHRSLLLNRDAKVVGIKHTTTGNRIELVLVFGGELSKVSVRQNPSNSIKR